nr:hypothetical protein [Bradyrhizobium sp. cf659]
MPRVQQSRPFFEDALCNSSDVGHDALMTMYRTRFHGQVDLVIAEELAEFWRE